MKDLIFNELTSTPLATNFSEAFKRVKQFVNTYKKRPSIFSKRIRLETYIGDLQLTVGMSIQGFCNETPQSRTLGSLLLGLGKHPFIEEGTTEEDQYLQNSFSFNRNGREEESIGLAAAHLNDTVCIGFESEECWRDVEHQIVVSNENGIVSTPTVLSISAPNHFHSLVVEEWLERNQPLSLVKSSLEPGDKPLHLRKDHGVEVLKPFAKRLRKSLYVTAIVNSLPFNPNQREFIKSTSSNGLIEIVLTNTDQGLGIVVQTTGRNLIETDAIARILKNQYS